MYQRPKLGETDEDLLRQQAEFLKASGKEATQKIIVKDEDNPNQHFIPNTIVGNIVEKNHGSLNYSASIVKPPEGFPKPFEIDPSIPAVKKERKSLFAWQLEKNKKQLGKNLKPEPMEVDAVVPSELASRESKSFIVTGPEAEKIHEENLRTISQMSEKDILEEQKKLQEYLDPKLLEFLKNKRKKTTEQEKASTNNMSSPSSSKKLKQFNDDELENIKPTDSDVNLDVDVKEKLTKYVDEKWVNMDFVEKEKLEWIGDIPDAKTLEPDQPYSARFDFQGELQPFSAEIDVTKSLHHHGDEPERPGYTIQELYQLSRSSVLQQRNLALNTLANIIRKTKLGYYDMCFDGALLHNLVESDLFFLLRFSIDENSLIPVAINCLRRLLCSDTDEFALDKLLGITDVDEQPLLFIKMEVNNDEEKELKDHVLIGCDLIKGVLRTDLLVRLGYILNNLSPNRETVINIILCLIRIARHSLEAAQEIIKMPNLLSYVYSCIKSENPIHQGVKLFRILIGHSRECAWEIGKHFPMNFLISYVDAEDIQSLSKSEFYLLKLESMYLWRCLLHYNLMVDDFLSWTPCFIRILRFYIEKVDINSNTDFDFELFSAISSVFVTCIRKRIALDPNYLVMMYVCLEKWLKQLIQFNEYNYAGSKAIGSLFRFFIAYFEVHGVDESNVKFIKKVHSIITSLICSQIFETMSLKLIINSHILSAKNIKRDPKNLPSLESIYEGGNDYLKIIQNSSALPFFISLAAFLKSSYYISHECISAVELLTDCSNLRKYTEKILDHKVEKYNWFMNFEKMFLVNLLDLLVVKDDDYTLKIAFKLLSISRIDDVDSKRIFSVISDPKVWNSEDSEYFKQLSDLYCNVYLNISVEKPMTVNYENEMIPEDWTYKAVSLLRETDNIYNVRNVLKFISLLLKEKPGLLDTVPYTLRYYHLSTVFLTDSNVFDAEILKYLQIIFEDIVLNRLKINLNKKVNDKKSFYDLYTELITQYAGLSYGEPLFAQFVLFPLQNRFDISFRKLLWSEYLHVLRVITISYPVQNFIDIPEFTEPCETDESLLVTYFNAVNNKAIFKTRNPFIYNLSINNVKNYLKSDMTNERLSNFLKMKIDSISDPNLKADFMQ